MLEQVNERFLVPLLHTIGKLRCTFGKRAFQFEVTWWMLNQTSLTFRNSRKLTTVTRLVDVYLANSVRDQTSRSTRRVREIHSEWGRGLSTRSSTRITTLVQVQVKEASARVGCMSSLSSSAFSPRPGMRPLSCI